MVFEIGNGKGMIPYPEPYQTMYQQRRLGALGFEWRPSSIKFAVGVDFSLDPYYHVLPLVDLDALVDPLPEFVDAMDWEPEIEIHSDDNDSEYNIMEDYSSGGEQVSPSSDSDEPECSSENSEDEDSHRDGLRRSKRKKQKVMMISSVIIYLYEVNPFVLFSSLLSFGGRSGAVWLVCAGRVGRINSLHSFHILGGLRNIFWEVFEDKELGWV